MSVDGEGVTTLVAGTGCPLSCKWCINKEVLATGKPEHVSAEELYERVKIDDLYFRATGGGITFGGGESLLQAGFFEAFRKVCGNSWRLYAETSLSVPVKMVSLAIPWIDEFIVDCKDMHSDIYHAYTGGDKELMEDNLRFLLREVGKERVVVRVPLIPEFNTKELRRESIEYLKKMGVARLDVFSYIKKKGS